jgi:hypothetical protein
MKILGQIKNGKMSFSEYNSRTWHDYCKNKSNDGRVIVVQDRLPESFKQRRFFEGAVIPLWAFLNGWDYHDNEILKFLRETAKREFNGEIVKLDGKEIKRGKSTKGLLAENDKQQSGFLERVITHLEEQYGIDRMKVLNPEHYKMFMEEIYSVNDYDDYIDYLIKLNFLKNEML